MALDAKVLAIFWGSPDRGFGASCSRGFLNCLGDEQAVGVYRAGLSEVIHESVIHLTSNLQ